MNKKTCEILYSLLPESATAMSQALPRWEKENNHIVVSVIKRCVSLVVGNRLYNCIVRLSRGSTQ